MKIKLILLFIVGAFVACCVSKWQAKAEAALAAGIIAECYLRDNVLKTPKPIAPGITLVASGDRVRAKEYFEKALAADPNCIRAIAGIAQLLPLKDERRKKLLEHSITVQPTFHALVELGDYYRSIDRDFAKAHDVYAAAIKITPRETGVYRKLVDVAKRLGDSEKEAYWKAERKRNA